MSHAKTHFAEAIQILERLDAEVCEKLVDLLVALRSRGGRLFVLGVGGSAANASHAVNDFRKLCGIEAYTPTDNVAELTARTNDDGWETTFEAWLRVSKLDRDDLLLILSVGGGDRERNVSPNLIRAFELAKERGTSILAIVGRKGGAAAGAARVAVIVPTVEPAAV